ncbi:deoxycytidyl transferase [Lunasporangiospora selenospora]|uniref:Deoxycytidyl transferase n=1 Tax=Lunasporangiospora selenospora TaxID=979761 RepID=A0A9P6FTJ0_9FUNG|nr:deoxycytidyl transferase [Lunasporangiospora selenospora]
MQEQEDDPYAAVEYRDYASYFRNKRQKLQNQNDERASAAPNVSQIFEGVIVYVNGYTDPPSHLSKSQITHIIASNLTQAKMKEFKNYKVAKPEWVVESIKANTLLPWHRFNVLRTPSSFPKLESSMNLKASQRSPIATDLAVSGVAPISGSELQDSSLGYLDENENDMIASLLDQHPDVQHESDFGLDQRNQSLEHSNTSATNNGMMLDKADPTGALSLDDSVNPSLSIENQPTDPLKGHPYTPSLIPPDLSKELASKRREPSVPIDQTESLQMQPGGVDNRHPTLIELSVPWNRLNSSVQPGFVEKYYQSSRLHYLSAWKAKLREVTALYQKKRPTVLSKSKVRMIMHVDFDCFFASVASRGKPELVDKPIGVAHGSGGSTSNSEIASCNYKAREFGVKNGMHLKSARALCPDLVVVPYEFQQYEDISIEFYKILLGNSDELQAVSVDEALVDVTSKCFPCWGSKGGAAIKSGQLGTPAQLHPKVFAQKIRERIYETTGCHASVGIGPNVLLAKLATKRAKPHGQYIWQGAPGSEETILELQGPQTILTTAPPVIAPDAAVSIDDASSQSQQDDELINTKVTQPAKRLGVKDLPGVGSKITRELEERLSVSTILELQKVTREVLQQVCGAKTGDMLYKYCRGIDDSTLESDRDKARQSVSAEISWGVRFENQIQVEVFVNDLAMEVSRRLIEIDMKGRSVVMKVMKRNPAVKGHWKHLGHGPVDQFARTGQLSAFTDDPNLIAKESLKLLQQFNFDVLDIRETYENIAAEILKGEGDSALTKNEYGNPDGSTRHDDKPKSEEWKELEAVDPVGQEDQGNDTVIDQDTDNAQQQDLPSPQICKEEDTAEWVEAMQSMRPRLLECREIGELRGLVDAWKESTLLRLPQSTREAEGGSSSRSSSGQTGLIDIGPCPEDVEQFIEFVVQVVEMERDLERVRLLLSWLLRRVQAGGIPPAHPELLEGHRMTWDAAWEVISGAVQERVAMLYGGSLSLS